MTQIKVFSLFGETDEDVLNKFLKGVNVVDLVYIGEQTPPGGWPLPQVMVVYEVKD